MNAFYANTQLYATLKDCIVIVVHMSSVRVRNKCKYHMAKTFMATDKVVKSCIVSCIKINMYHAELILQLKWPL